ncbi:hypothetical protein V8E55_003426 [Tylopilus felleus]
MFVREEMINCRNAGKHYWPPSQTKFVSIHSCLSRLDFGHGPAPSPEVARKLEDLRKFSLNSLMMFLGIHLIAESKALASLTLAFLIYTITLHLAISTSFLQNCPNLSRLLHTIPFLGISFMAAVELVMGAHSPALAVGGLLVGTLPLLVIAVYHARLHGEMHLPVRLHKFAPLVPEPTEMTAV